MPLMIVGGCGGAKQDPRKLPRPADFSGPAKTAGARRQAANLQAIVEKQSVQKERRQSRVQGNRVIHSPFAARREHFKN
jgi:hypothetical protein